MTLCDLRHLPHNTGPYFALTPDRALVLSAAPGEFVRCTNCPNIHVRVVAKATAANVRELAHSLTLLAAELEAK